MDRATLKSNAKDSLQGKYGDAILLFVIYSLITGFVTGVFTMFSRVLETDYSLFGYFGNLLSIVIACLFIFGIHSYFLKISRNEKVDWKELFSKMNMIDVAICITVVVLVYVTLWSLLLIVPGIIAAINYSQVYFIKLDNPKLKTGEVLAKSKELMNGHKMDYFVLCLSFIGWFILGALTLGILYLWIIPYMSVTQANFYNELVKKTKKK